MSAPYDPSQGQGPQWGRPQQPNHGQQPPHGQQPQYDQPQYDQPQYNQPQGDQWGRPGYGQGQQYGQNDQYGQGQQYGQNDQYGQGQQYGQNDQGQQYGHGQQWGQPSYEQPSYGQPSYGQPSSGQPSSGQQGVQYDQYGRPVYPLGGQPPKANRGRTRGIIAAAAAVVVIGGGVGTYVAVSSSSGAGGGASDPQGAVQTLVSDVNNSDLIGLLDDLAPGERDAIAKPFQTQFDELKKDGLLTSQADASHFSGVDVTASNLKYGTVRTINDHVRIVPVTGGTIHVSADAAKLPLTKKFLDMIEHNSMNGSTKVDKTIDVAKVEQQTGKPVEIATQQVDGKWYPSLFYTVADYATRAAHLQAPTQSIPAVGASSADDAVRSMITDLFAGKVRDAIELTSPDEMAVLHDYGQLIVEHAHYDPAPVTIEDIQFSDSSIDGGTRVSLKSLDARIDGNAVQVQIADNCVHVTAQGRSQNFCASNAIALAEQNGTELTTAQKQAVTDLFSAVSSIGIDTSQSGGQWYVDPARSYFDLSGEILGKLRSGDLTALLSLAMHN